MADVQATFAFVAEDKTSGACASATASLETMRDAVKSDVQEMAALRAAMRNLKGPGAENSEVFKQLHDQMTALKARVQSGTEEYIKAGGSAKELSARQSSVVEVTRLLTEQQKKALGPWGELVERGEAMWKTLGAGGVAALGAAAAIVALGAVVLAASVAVAQLVYKLAEMALVSSDAAIKSQVMLEGLTGSAGAAGQLSESIDSVAAGVPLARDQVASLAEGLWKSGKRGSELEKALEKAALETAKLGKASPEALAASMANLDVLSLKFKEHVQDIFSGPRTTESVGRFEGALKRMVDMFDKNSAAGHALQVIVSTIVSPLFDALTAAEPYAKRFFQGMMIGALLLLVAVGKLKKAFDDAFGGIDLSGIDGMNVALWAGVVVVGVVVVALGLLALAALIVVAAVMALVVSVGAFLAMFVAIPALIVGVAAVLMVAIPAAIAYALTALYELGASGLQAASDLIDGLVNGITSGAGRVFSALQSMASQMGSTIMAALEIGSPSKLFRRFGEYTSEGMALGVEDGAPAVGEAVSAMVAPPELAQGGSGSGSKGGTRQIVVKLEGGSAAEQKQARSFATQLCEEFERFCGEQGLELEATVV